MRRNLITKLAMLVAGSLFLASFSPSLDGRAVVVDEGVMPSGLFAKTVGYLPGDIISVSNVAQNKNVDLLVIGALDASEGVAIMLTPEAAEACGIEKNSNSIVKITKRNDQDDRVYGSAVISGGEPDAKKLAKEDSEDALPSDASVAEEVFEEEGPAAEAVAEASDDQSGKELAAMTEEEDFEDESPLASEAFDDDLSEELADAPLIEKAEDSSEAQKRASERAENALALAPEKEPPASELEERVEDLSEIEDEIARENVAALPFEEEDDDVEEAENAETEPLLPAPAIASEDFSDEPEAEEDGFESYDAIVLVPAAENPPVSESTEGEAEPASASVKSEGTALAAEKSYEARELSYKDFMISDAKDLKGNSYYVQIATMQDEANIQAVVDKYGSNYPIAILPLPNDSKQILIGSLNMDEYAVVLERFKSYGYKDAFLRKTK